MLTINIISTIVSTVSMLLPGVDRVLTYWYSWCIKTIEIDWKRSVSRKTNPATWNSGQRLQMQLFRPEHRSFEQCLPWMMTMMMIMLLWWWWRFQFSQLHPITPKQSAAIQNIPMKCNALHVCTTVHCNPLHPTLTKWHFLLLHWMSLHFTTQSNFLYQTVCYSIRFSHSTALFVLHCGFQDFTVLWLMG